jgi:hypothetical protein
VGGREGRYAPSMIIDENKKYGGGRAGGREGGRKEGVD